MTAPYHQVAGVGVVDSLETLDSVVEIARARVGIGKTGFFVDGMNQVGTIRAGMATNFGIQGRSYHRKPVILIQDAVAIAPRVSLCHLLQRTVIVGLLLLRP